MYVCMTVCPSVQVRVCVCELRIRCAQQNAKMIFFSSLALLLCSLVIWSSRPPVLPPSYSDAATPAATEDPCHKAIPLTAVSSLLPLISSVSPLISLLHFHEVMGRRDVAEASPLVTTCSALDSFPRSCPSDAIMCYSQADKSRGSGGRG